MRHTALLATASIVALLAGVGTSSAASLMQTGGGSQGSGMPIPTPQSVAAAVAARQSQDTLNRTTEALQAMQAALAAARGISATGGVPNGLAPGGLQVAPRAMPGSELWRGADLPVETRAGNMSAVTVRQTLNRAILNWQSFSVGANTTLTFDQQGNRDWVALNRVIGDVAPSRILGSIRADGQVYVVNQNGILFGGTAQVNVGALVASTARIADEQFLKYGLYAPQSGGAYVPSFTGAVGDVRVEAGARIVTHAPGSATSSGGFVMLLGKTVENAGEILLPKGQALLAAGDDFILRKGFGTDSNQISTTRGSEVATGTWVGDAATGTWIPGGGAVTNRGLILAPQGDVTLAGRQVVQAGTVVTTSSVNTRGTIHLLNAISDQQGAVVLAKGSLTAVLPELDGAETAPDSQRDALIATSALYNVQRLGTASGQFDNLSRLSDRLDQGRVEVVSGGTIRFASGSLTAAKGGQIAASAPAGRITVETAAELDVSGVNGVKIAAMSNVVKVSIQGNEMRDAPLNRDSDVLKNQSVWVDIRDLVTVAAGTGGYPAERVYTKGGLLEVSGYLNNIKHGIGEWTALGGSITLAASEVAAARGSVFDISGGSLSYQAGFVPSTLVFGADGRTYSIGNAPANVPIVGIAGQFVRDHRRWGIKEIWASPLFGREIWQDGYTVGRDAGQLILSTPAATFEGSIVADVINGERQTAARSSRVTDPYKVNQGAVPLAGTVVVKTDALVGTSVMTRPVTGDVTISATRPDNASGGLWFDDQALNAAGLGGLWVATTGKIAVNDPLAVTPGGAIALYGGTVRINADLTARGGSVTLGQTTDGSLVKNTSVTLADGVVIDTRGLWSNIALDPAASWRQALVNGGAVTIRSYGDVSLGAGSVIDASAGGAITSAGKLVGGDGGDITLVASYVQGDDAPNHGDLTLGGTLRAYGFGRGGRLVLETGGSVSIGGTLGQGPTLSAGTAAPFDLALSEPLIIGAGSVLPFSVSYQISHLRDGDVVPANATSYGQPATIGPAGWTLPAGMGAYSADYSTYYASGDTIPAGAVLSQVDGRYPDGYRIPQGTFVGGIGITPIVFNYVAGTTAAADAIYPVGSRIPRGTVLGLDAAVQPVANLRLDPSLFASGFSAYTVNGQTGLLVADNTAIRAEMPVLRMTANTFTAPTDSALTAVAELWTPPQYLDDPAKGQLTRRGGAGIALLSGVGADGSGVSQNQGLLTLGAGASVTVDPGQRVRLASSGQITIDGRVTAPGGGIDVVNNFQQLRNTDPGNLSIWIGSSAVLSVAAEVAIAYDMQGRAYGVVPDGGTINIGSTGGRMTLKNDSNVAYQTGLEASTHAYVIIRPGAVLDASGAHGPLDIVTGRNASRVMVASSGGTIALRSYSGIHAEGSMRAMSGGVGGAGGVLSMSLESPMLVDIPWVVEPTEAQKAGRVLTLSAAQGAGGLAADLLPGQADPHLVLGRGSITTAQIVAGGFASASLQGRAAILFDGDVALALSRSLTLKAGQYAVTSGSASLAAPYVSFGGQDIITGSGLVPNLVPTFADTGRLSVTGDLIEVAGIVQLSSAKSSFASTGDLRFVMGATSAAPGLYAAHDLDLSARRIYAASNIDASLRAGYTVFTGSGQPGSNPGGSSPPGWVLFDPNAVLTLSRPDPSEAVAVPYSVFASLDLVAPTIVQGAALFAPLGAINFTASQSPFAVGTNTSPQVVHLLPGSITSVSARGLAMPYGGTTDGVSWTVDGAAPAVLNLVTGQYLTADGKPRTNRDATGINISATNVVKDDGSLVDVSGGGKLLGAGFVTGRGGSVDVLLNPLVAANPANAFSAPGSQVYALLPGVVTAPVAGGAAAAWTGSVAAPGQQITIPAGVPGLPAGTYTLLPANYALVPGAFRVELGSVTTRPTEGAVALANGSYMLAGYRSIANTLSRDALPTGVIVTPGQAVRTMSGYNEQSYAAFQLARAATFQTVRPMLEMDAKHLTLNFGAIDTTMSPASATAPALVWQGSTDMRAAAGGLGGVLSIMAATTSNNPNDPLPALVITAPGSTVLRSADRIVLAADIINGFGAPNLFIGGSPNTREDFPNVITISDPKSRSAGFRKITLESGARLTGGLVALAYSSTGSSDTIRLDSGAVIDTRGFADQALLDASLGFSYGNAMLIAANRPILYDVANAQKLAQARVSIGDGAAIYARDTIGFGGGVSFDGRPILSARTLSATGAAINLGSAADLAAARAAGTLPAGFDLTQDLFAALVAGNPADNIAGIRNLALSTNSSVNIYGSGGLDLSALDTLTLTAPALYGAGSNRDAFALKLGTLIWNVGMTRSSSPSGGFTYAGTPPGATIANGPGNGSGTLVIDARRIEVGRPNALSDSAMVTFDHLLLGFSGVTLAASERISTAGKVTLSAWQSGPDPHTAFDPATYAGVGGNLHLVTPLLTTDAAGIATVRSGGDLTLSRPQNASPVDTAMVTALGGRINLIAKGAATLDSAIALPGGLLTVSASGDIVLGSQSRLDFSGRAISFADVTRHSWGGDVVIESAHGSILQYAGAVIDVSAAHNDAGTITLTATDAAAGRVGLAGTLKGAGGGGFRGGSIDLRAQTIGDPANLTADFAALNAALSDAGFSESRHFVLKQGNLVVGHELKAHDIAVSVDGGSLIINGTVDAAGARVGAISLAARDDLVLNGVLDVHGTVLAVDSYGQPIEAKNRGHIELATKAGTLRLNAGATMDLSTPGGAYGQVVLNAPRTGETSGDIAVVASGPLAIRGASTIALNAVWTYALPGGSTITQGTLDGYDAASRTFINAALANSGLQSRLAGLTAYGDTFHLRPGVEITSSGVLSTSGDIDLAAYRYGPKADRDPNSATYGAGEAMSLVVRASGDLTLGGSLSDGFKGVAGVPPTLSTVADVSNAPDTFMYIAASKQYRVIPGQTVTVAVAGAAGWVVPAISSSRFYPRDISGTVYAPSTTIPNGTVLNVLFIPLAAAADAANAFATVTDPGRPTYAGTSAMAVMQAPGTQSASLRLVAGADLTAASTRVLRAASALASSGNLVLANPNNDANGIPIPSTLRTGTGALDLLAGGNYRQDSLFGVYTAGTDTGATGLATGSYMSNHGGDLSLVVQGDATGYNYHSEYSFFAHARSWSPANWLVRAVDGNGYASWAIRFGGITSFDDKSYIAGFTGLGTLGGGNVALMVGGNAGTLTSTIDNGNGYSVYGALQVVAAASGQVTSVTRDGAIVTGGTLIEAGGGDVTVKVRGAFNTATNVDSRSYAPDGSLSLIGSLRGDSRVQAGTIGVVSPTFGRRAAGDPRGGDPAAAGFALPSGGIGLMPGDGITVVRAAGDLVIGNYLDAGQMPDPIGISKVDISLWRPETTAVDVAALGGNLVPGHGDGFGALWWDVNAKSLVMTPGRLGVMAGGSLYLGGAGLELAPSSRGQLDLLAGQSIFGAGLIGGYNLDPSRASSQAVTMSGASAGVNDLINPFRPYQRQGTTGRKGFFAFQADTPSSNLHEGDTQPIHIVAARGDIVNLAFGRTVQFVNETGVSSLYVAAKAARITAGGDIVNLGGVEVTPFGGLVRSSGLILNANATDVSTITAGGDIFYANMTVAGPGTLEVLAGRNLYQADIGYLRSFGPLVPGDNRLGATITAMAGIGGAGAPDYAALATRYLDPGNLADPALPLAEQAGRVAKTYEQELAVWMNRRYGFAGTLQQAKAAFDVLPPEQQRIFLREVYFAELTQGARESQDPASRRYGSYLRGREMIATLFPDVGADGAAIGRVGDITMFSSQSIDPDTGASKVADGGIRTGAGGAIQTFAPGGKIVVGVEGVVPGADSGLVTQGPGDIQIYARNSILLGLSRIMTTFGGNIIAWSAEGDINAGRGAKTTQVYTLPKRITDNYGNVVLSPQAPATGAGIATLQSIPEAPKGDTDLAAPLGTIDPGEAGIRVSGNLTLAALRVVNTANIEVGGSSRGIPTVEAPNIGALTTASHAAGAAAKAADTPTQRAADAQSSIIMVEVLGYGGGGGDEQPRREERPKPGRQSSIDYEPAGMTRILATGTFPAEATTELTAEERHTLRQVVSPASP